MSRQIVDDSDPAVRYSLGWQKAGGGNEYNSTTSSTNQALATATISFVGVRVAAYGTIGPRSGLNTPNSNYAIDGGTGLVFSPTQDQNVRYNQLFFTSPPLSDGQHTLVVTNLKNNSDSLYIDYFLIFKSVPNTSSSSSLEPTKVITVSANSTSHPPSSTSRSLASPSPTATIDPDPAGSNTATVIGSAFGAAALVIAAVAFIVWLRGRRKRDRLGDEPVTVPKLKVDPDSISEWDHTRYPSDRYGTVPVDGHAFVSNEVVQPSMVPQQAVPQQAHDGQYPYDPYAYGFPSPPGYSYDVSQLFNPVAQDTPSGNPRPKVTHLTYDHPSYGNTFTSG